MTTMWKTIQLYLGLGPDEEYDDYDPDDDAAEDAADDEVAPSRSAPPEPPPARTGAVRPLPRERQVTSERSGATSLARRPAVVRTLGPSPSSPKPFAVAPESFNDAQSVADTYMAATPVIMSLEGVDRALSRRLVDFASGLCYGTGGQMEKINTSVYLLTPNDVEVSAEDRRKLRHGGG